jgi:hypothetical protein
MEIARSGSQPSSKGPAEWFTGDVIIDQLFEAPEPARVRAASVTFEPGAHRMLEVPFKHKRETTLPPSLLSRISA